MNENEVGTVVVDTAVEVHRQLGPGLLESVYTAVMAYELTTRGLIVQREVPIPFVYKNMTFNEGFRADLIINNIVLVELKSVEALSAAHRKQVQTYLRLTSMKLGYLLNFGAALMKDGIVRAVNRLPE
jgi:GxxExxY protein